MLCRLRDLSASRIQATDGEIGSVEDIYFDDMYWRIRYLVVDTGRWLPGRSVLISPHVAGKPDLRNTRIPVSLTKEQVKNSPGAETHSPVSRQYEVELSNYYGWPAYWGPGTFMPGPVMPPPVAPAMVASEMTPPVPPIEGHGLNLRSMREVKGYHIQSSDEEIGHVEDFIADDEDWHIRYLLVDTRNWLPGRKALVSPQWVERISWGDRRVYVGLPSDAIRNSPEFDSTAPITRQYEETLHDWYDRPRYW